MTILFVNACVRGEESKTLKLCRAALDELKQKYPQAQVREVNLNLDRPEPLHPELAQERSALHAAKDYNHPIFDYAKEFAAADQILIGAPYWDLSFPSVLKIYLERVCAVDVTFAYSPEGKPYSLCKATKLLYVTTAGGPVGDYNLGYDYIKGLSDVFFGIQEVQCFDVRGLDMGVDVAALIAQGEEDIRKLIRSWHS